MLLRMLFVLSLGLICTCATEAQDKAKKDLDDDVKGIIGTLRNPILKKRIQGAQALGQMGPDAKDAAQALCEVLILEKSPLMKQATIEAIEKIRPDLYKPILALLAGQPSTQAILELGSMGEKAAPTVPILKTLLRLEVSSGLASRYGYDFGRYSDQYLAKACFLALEKIVPDDLEQVRIWLAIAAPANKSAFGRITAIQKLGFIAAKKPELRNQLLPTVYVGLKNEDCQLSAVKALGLFGAEAKGAIPDLRVLKLSSNSTIREAAGIALDKIESKLDK